MGTSYKAGGAVVVPSLSEHVAKKHVAKKMAAQSAIMKERRKLDENRKTKNPPQRQRKGGEKGDLLTRGRAGSGAVSKFSIAAKGFHAG